MKRNVIFVFAFAAFALILSGCGGGSSTTGDAEIDKYLDEMGFDKAPELGGLARKFFVAMYNGDADFIWDNMTKGGKDGFQKQLDEMKKLYKDKDIDKLIEEAQASLDKAPEAQKEYLKMVLDKMKADKEAIDKDSPKALLEAMIKMMFKDKEKAKKEMMKDKAKIIGEDFSEDKKTGWLKMKEGDDEEKGMTFTKEDGAWKIDFMGN